MTLTMTPSLNGDADVTVAPGANTSASIQTSISELLRERARQAVYAGAQVQIGGEEFYVVLEGGEKGTRLYFPASLRDRLDERDARNLVPTLAADVSHVVNGRTERYQNTDLGTINGTHYHLEWNGSEFVPVVGFGKVH